MEPPPPPVKYSMIVAFAKISALLFIVLTVAPAVAHALEYPGKMRLSREQYFTVQRIYYPGFMCIGVTEPLAVLALAALLCLTPKDAPAFSLIAGALLAAVATHLVYWIIIAPINRVWLRRELRSRNRQGFLRAGADPERDWMRLRDRWERSHAARAATSLAAFLLLAFAVAT